MTASAAGTTIRIVAGNTIFSVPERVATEEKLFEAHGLDVVTEHDWDTRNFVIKDQQKDPLKQFEGGASDTFNMCEWGVLHRIEHSERPARIVYLRPAIVAQALVSFRPEIQEPHDLASTVVGINETTGQHFTTLKLLEGALDRDQIKLEHGGGPADLYQHLHDDTYAAVTLMEPFLSLALKNGGHILGSFFYRGAQAFSTDIPAEAQRAYVAAVNEAVDLINANPDAYRSHVVAAAGGRLAPEDLSSDYYRYVHALPYSEERFEDQYSWLKEWDLVEGNRSYKDIIDASALTGV